MGCIPCKPGGHASQSDHLSHRTTPTLSGERPHCGYDQAFYGCDQECSGTSDQTPVVTFDQPLFALAKQIQWKWPEEYGEEKFVILFGGLHIEMAALKTLGDWLQGSGWVQALVQAEITSAGTADSFLRASHVSRTRRAHQVTAAALFALQQRAYKHYFDQLIDTRNEQLKFDDWCQQKADTCPQFHYWATVLQLELTVLTYVRSLRQASFAMYIDALRELAVWFHAMDHTNYGRWIPVHLRDMMELPTAHPEIAQEFRAGNFTIQKTNRPFSNIPIDQAHEQNNAAIKGDGGAVGLTDNPSALRRWMVAGPEVARLIEEFWDEADPGNRPEHTFHHDQSASVQTAFLKDVQSMVNVMEDFGNPFEEESQDLLVLDTKEIAPPAAVDALRHAREVGQQQFDNFVRERLVERTKPIEDTIHRNKLKIFGTPASKPSGEGKQQLKSLKNDLGLFSRLYIGCQNRDGNLEEFFRHESQACPPALSDGGSIRLGVKSDLLSCLETLSEPTSVVPPTSCIVLDGAVIIQMLKPATAKTFSEYAQRVFVPYILSKLHQATRLDLVWDRYNTDSLKGTARAKRGRGVRRRVVGSATIPGNWNSFLRVDENKTELFSFLSGILQDSFQLADKQLVITDGDDVMSKPPIPDTAALAPCNHEEADSRIMLHAAHAAHHNGYKKILIRTVDTDVVVLAVALARTLEEEAEVWVSFGTGKAFRFLAAHQMARALGPDKAQALPMFHALTGCDTVSCFAGHGKKTAWAVWTALPQLTQTLINLSAAPDHIHEDAMHILERFVILLYDKTSTATDIDKARRKLFAKKSNVQLIPPTSAALKQHVRRAVYQGGHVWGQALIPAPTLPSPSDWGWIKTSGMYEPLWTTLPEASKVCRELVSCQCQEGCIKKCKCKKATLECTPLCACDGECSQN